MIVLQIAKQQKITSNYTNYHIYTIIQIQITNYQQLLQTIKCIV